MCIPIQSCVNAGSVAVAIVPSSSVSLKPAGTANTAPYLKHKQAFNLVPNHGDWRGKTRDSESSISRLGK
jgi:hypothetical protein